MSNIYILNQYFTTTLSVGGGIDSSQTSGIVLASASGLDTTKPGIACLTWADPLVEDDAEWITYTSINGSNELQGVARGQEGSTGKAHLNGAVISFPVSESHVNQIAAAVVIGGDYTNGLQGILDEDDMASNSAVKGVTQQSLVSYVASQAASDGWLSADAMTYASAQSVTVSGDVTAKYRKGTKIKLTNDGGTDYYIVKSAAYSSPNTTITFMTGTNYALANSSITNPYYSYADNPQAFPHWFSFTPSLTANGGGSFTPSWREAKFNVQGGTCTLNMTTNGHTISGTVTSIDIDTPIDQAGETSTGFEQGISGYSQTSTQVLRIVSVDANTFRIQPTSGNFAAVAGTGYLGFKHIFQI